jgi:hypothetical protein
MTRARVVIALVPLLAALAGCSTATRKTEVWLGRNATLTVDGQPVPVSPDGPTRFEVPVRPQNRIRIDEPRKAAVVEETRTEIDPPGDVEDRLYFNSTANVVVVFTGEKGAIAARAGPQALFPDPISRLKDEHGPFFCPPYGQGVLVVSSDHGAVVTIDKKFRQKLEPAPDATRDERWSRPQPIELDAGWHTVEVARTGLKPYVGDFLVRTGEYTLLGVRLADEKRRAGDD